MARNDPIYKLVYFDLRGLAETARYIFAYAAVEYEDYRVKREEWPYQKDATPFRTLPYLEVDGDVIGQSNAICRFLAHRFNLAGHDDLQQARVDALVDYVNDVRTGGLIGWIREEDKEQKEKLKAEFFNKTVDVYLATFEKHLKANVDGNREYFVGNAPTWADFHIAILMGMLQEGEANVLAKYPLLKAHKARVDNLKGITDWIAKRPKTAM
ncbi:putative Hematopoietic prostaglandin D synthase [Hypsibius exemplaris]|uniref:glutathione transferase n=1 Tax=Hypsibius exemplaris TaxID=2072580 RepID=A0A1W0X244_HYPEX|nr:putative Hematopoietic prostaglandin D synthase [Hypsibius exemplaris]